MSITAFISMVIALKAVSGACTELSDTWMRTAYKGHMHSTQQAQTTDKLDENNPRHL